VKSQANTEWYCAKIELRAQLNELDDSLRELAWVLVHAPSLDEARTKAARLGRDREHAYRNDAGETVSWKFDRVVEVQEIDGAAPEDGIEVFSELSESR